MILNNNIIGRKVKRNLSELIEVIHNPSVEYLEVTQVGLAVTNILVGDVVVVYSYSLRPIWLQESLHFYTPATNVIATI